MKELIEAIEDRLGPLGTDSVPVVQWNNALLMTVEIITEHLKDKVIVPIDPTDAMVASFKSEFHDIEIDKGYDDRLFDSIKAMLSATNKGEG